MRLRHEKIKNGAEIRNAKLMPSMNTPLPTIKSITLPQTKKRNIGKVMLKTLSKDSRRFPIFKRGWLFVMFGNKERK